MKNLFLAFLLIGYAHQTNAQSEVPFEEGIYNKKVPVALLESLTIDYDTYSMKEVFGVSLENVKQSVIAYRDENSIEEYDFFQVNLSNKGNNGIKGQMVLTYDKEGKLLNVVEKLKNEHLPVVVRNTVAKNYPGWSIIEENYKMIQFDGKDKKENYHFKLKKDKKILKITTDLNGNTLKA